MTRVATLTKENMESSYAAAIAIPGSISCTITTITLLSLCIIVFTKSRKGATYDLKGRKEPDQSFMDSKGGKDILENLAVVTSMGPREGYLKIRAKFDVRNGIALH